MREWQRMYKIMATILMSLWTCSALAQAAPSEYQPGTILSVKSRQEANESDPSVERFDVAVQVADTVYTVLYTQPAGIIGVQHRAGLELLVLIKEKTLRFNFLGASREVPILRREPAAPREKR